MRVRLYGMVILLFLILFALLTFGSRQISLTSDEPAHLAGGYAILKQGKNAFWILPQHGHPPLLNVLSALLFYIEKPNILVEQLDGWPLWYSNYVRAFVPYLAPAERMEVVIRMPIILLTMVLGAVVFRWGKDLWGVIPGLIALLVLTFDPLLLAHGRLATTDAGTVTLGILALYLSWRWAEKPSWRLAWMTGILLGCTMLSKGSGTLWALATGLVVLGMSLRKDPKTALRMILQGAWMGFLGLFIVWAGHAFTWGPVRDDFPFSLPAPAHWNGIISQARSVEKRWVFALEMRTHGGWWWYFPLAFMIKNPIPLLISLIIGLVFCLRRPFSRTRFLTLGLFPLLYTAAAIRSGMNIGYRHMLPVHPFIYLVTGAGIWKWLSHTRPRFLRLRRLFVILLGLWYISGTLRMFGYEIAYFNELIGGPRNGHRYLIDSNIDWGQGYKALRTYLDKHPGSIPYLSPNFLNIDPGLYGIAFRPLAPEWEAPPLTAPFHPLPGRYIISLTTLQRGWPEDPDMYAWFRQIEPTARVGYSFFVYDINPPPLEWIVQCLPVPLSDNALAWGFGGANVRRADLDCASAWLYPWRGSVPGVYALHHSLVPEKAHTFPSLLPSSPRPQDHFLARRLANLRLSVNIRRYSPDFNPFVLYEQNSPPAIPVDVSVITSTAGNLWHSTVITRTPPVPLNGPLTFLGVASYWTESQLEVETWWQVTEGPITRPLSIMGHLLNGAGELIGQADGLGVPPVVWQPGDVIVQRHRFPRPPAGTELWLRTGAYWLDTMERWKVPETPDADILLVPLEFSP